MKKNIARILSFALVLTLMQGAFPMRAAAAHIHNYIVDKGKPTYEWVDDTYHNVVETHTHICACGDMFKETHVEATNKHTPAVGSGVYEGSYEGAGGVLVHTYRYTCSTCKYTYRQNVYSRSNLASEEETEASEEATE